MTCYDCAYYGGWGAINLIKCNKTGRLHIAEVGCEDYSRDEELKE